MVHGVVTASFLAAAFYGYAAAYFGLLAQRKTAVLDHIRMAAFAASLCFHSISNALLAYPELVDWQPTALRLSTLSATTTIAAYIEFACRVARRPFRFDKLLLGWIAIGGIGVVTGAMVHAHPPSFAPLIVLIDAPALHRVSLSTFGAAHLLLGLALTIPAARALLNGLHLPEVRILVIPMFLGLLSGTHDILLRLGVIRSIYLSEYVALLTIGAMVYVLIQRLSAQQETLHRTTDELVENRVALRRTHDRIVRTEEQASTGELAAVLAHEVRNPLAVIKNAVASLRRRRLDANDRVVLLDILDEETARLHRLVRDLLAYARPAYPKQTSVSVAVLLENVADYLRGKGTHEVLLESTELPLSIFGDADQLANALQHIADNALQASPPDAPIRLRSERAQIGHRTAVAICIEDRGSGMSHEMGSKAKTSFFTTKATGTGLGLAIVERIVQGHFGRLDIDSREGQGTTVRMTLPIERHSEQPAPPSEGELPLTEIATIGES